VYLSWKGDDLIDYGLERLRLHWPCMSKQLPTSNSTNIGSLSHNIIEALVFGSKWPLLLLGSMAQRSVKNYIQNEKMLITLIYIHRVSLLFFSELPKYEIWFHNSFLFVIKTYIYQVQNIYFLLIIVRICTVVISYY
jgi:hypothetical protein